MNSKKSVGNAGEQQALQYYISQGYTQKQMHFTIKGGEIDLIVEKGEELVFVEVKVVNEIDDLSDFITPGKKRALKKTIQTYLYTHPHDGTTRVDVIFIRHHEIIEHFEHCEL